jgi:Rieske 2Fe-2S family protein
LASLRIAGRQLPREFFVDPAVHRRDVDRFFLGHWIVAGHLASIPREGDYFLYDIGFESIVIVRGANGKVHAAMNVCRHRGSRVAIEEYGHCSQFVCPMHGWAYALDGSLKTAPNMGANFDKPRHGLQTASVEVIDGIIFLSLDSPAGFAPGPEIHEFLAAYDLSATRIAYHRRYLCPANWKLVVATFFDLLACSAAYPQMREVMAPGTPSRESLADRISDHEDFDYDCCRAKLRPGFATQSQDGKLVAPPLGSQVPIDGMIHVVRVLSTWIIACPDYAAIVRLTPLEAQVTEMDVTWLVRESAVEGADYDAPRLSWLWRANVERALKLASDNQLGVNSTRYEPGPFAADEGEIEAWTSRYLARFA